MKINRRTYTAVTSGIAVGILNLGLGGFIFYFAMFFITTLFLMIKSKFKVNNYFSDPSELFFGSLTKDLVVIFKI